MKTTISVMMIALLLVSMLMFLSNVQQVKASGTIYIRADGSVDPPTAPIQRNGSNYILTGDLTDPIVIEKNDVVIDGRGHTAATYYLEIALITLIDRDNVTIKNMSISTSFDIGIYIRNSTHIGIVQNSISTYEGQGCMIMDNVSNCTIIENVIDAIKTYCIQMWSSFLNDIIGNSLSAWPQTGMVLEGSSNNSLVRNTLYVEGFGPVPVFSLSQSSGNIIYSNNWINGMGESCLQLDSSSNQWDNGYPCAGNYYSDYSGIDVYSGPYQNESGSDGVGDVRLLLAPNNRDNYPLMERYCDFDVAVRNVSPSKTAVPAGEDLSINVSVRNEGWLPVTFGLTVNATYEYSPAFRQYRLRANAINGWNNSIPGPMMSATVGDSVALTLEPTDNLHHKFYIDYNGNGFPDVLEPTSPDFINVNVTFTFVAETAGNFSYYCAYYPGTMFGQFVVNPAPHESTRIGSQNVTLTNRYEWKDIAFAWNTTGFNVGNYRLSAFAIPVPGESDTGDNSFKDGIVQIAPAITSFADGFESGDFGNWNGVSNSPGETGNVSTFSHHGVYSSRFYSNATGGTEWAYCYKDIGASSEPYARAYFYVPESGIVDEGDRVCFIQLNAGNTGINVAYAGWRKVGGIVKWYLAIRNGTSQVYADSAATPSVSSWYCLELHWKKGTSDGLGQLWINGVLTCSITGKNTAFYGDVTIARFGLAAVYDCGATSIYCDCVRLADSYIVPEPQNTTVVFSLTPSPAYIGQTVTLQGLLKDEYNSPLNNTQVNLYSNGTLVEHLYTNSTGGFFVTGKPGSPGTYVVTVSFNGTEILLPSNYTQTLKILPKINTNVTFTLSPNPAKMRQTITLLGNLTEQNGNPIGSAQVDISYSIDNGVNWIYAGTLHTNSTGWFTAQGKLTIVGTFLVRVSYKGNFKYGQSYHVETLTINP